MDDYKKNMNKSGLAIDDVYSDPKYSTMLKF